MSSPPPLIQPSRHTARRQWRRGCGLISAVARARGLDFAGPSPGGGTYFFRASSCALLSSSQIAEQQRPQAQLKERNGDSGSPLRPAAARPARAVGRGPVVVVVKEGAVHRQGQLQPSRQARSRQAAVVRVQAVPFLPRWHAPRRLRVRPAGSVGPGGHRRVHRAQVAGLRRGDQRALRHAGRGGRHRAGGVRQAGPDPGGDGAAVVQDGRHSARGHLRLLGRPLHALRFRDGAHGLRRAPPAPGLVQPRVHGQAVLPRPREVPRRIRRPGVPRRPHLQPARIRQGREVAQRAQAQGDQERQARHARHPRVLHPGARHRRRPVPEPARPPRRPCQQQRAYQPQVPLEHCALLAAACCLVQAARCVYS